MTAKRASFKNFKDSTAEDWQLIAAEYIEFAARLPQRVLDHLRLLEGDYGGFPVDRLEHCLQTATLAHRGGEDEEYVVCALLHDIGDTLGSYNHADVAAAILQPFISEENHWLIKHHQIFQGYDYFHHLGMDRNARDRFKDHPCYERTKRFCDLYDGPAFDPEFESLPLEFFEPMVKRVLASPKHGFLAQRD
ncbi:HD domain-containing protein [Exilibacterium tricleocarpae]|uniref:HD domain-containing protein n=1 Tax=Exilibacterium tricleocarpae TaxID=2591008 RepID=A0A545U5C4_9GAMM|nr:HD domain-containing protein [Exilibacterium tricleocarpae]TQV84675.1 HD domain-containing protein [Exilibacterium tricleocarpae]